MSFCKGDKVRTLDGKRTGKVIKVLGTKVMVQDEALRTRWGIHQDQCVLVDSTQQVTNGVSVSTALVDTALVDTASVGTALVVDPASVAADFYAAVQQVEGMEVTLADHQKSLKSLEADLQSATEDFQKILRQGAHQSTWEGMDKLAADLAATSQRISNIKRDIAEQKWDISDLQKEILAAQAGAQKALLQAVGGQ